MPVSEHRWIVDAIEDGSAAVQVDGQQMTTVPQWLLPAGVRGGDVLRVTHEREAQRSVLTITYDGPMTELAYEESARQVAELPGRERDAGGDVAL